MSNLPLQAPGAPGTPAKWTSSAKSGVGKSLSAFSQTSFTISHGIVNEIYYPREDNACIRDMEFLVTDGKDFFSEEKRDTRHTTRMAEPGIPAFHINNTCNQKRFSIDKELITDPLRSTLLQKVRFNPLIGNKADYHIYVLLAPHISNKGAENTAWLDEYKGVQMLFATRGNVTLALACSLPFAKRSAGFVGTSDGYMDILAHKAMTWQYDIAENGNTALTAEIDLGNAGDEFVLALAFGRDKYEAAQNARASLLDGFDAARKLYVQQWRDWHRAISVDHLAGAGSVNLFRNSVAIMRMHESDRFPGGIIASMSIPWGFDKGDENIGGYHLVWPRDLVQCSGGFLAFNAIDDAMRVMTYLLATQEADGHWPQNMWLEGNPYWNGLQLDQIAFPILLIGRCRHEGKLNANLEGASWAAVKKGVRFLISNGPISPQERWEEESGISVSTLSTCIAALLTAADFAEDKKESTLAQYCRETADYWNSQIEKWLYVTGTPLAKTVGVEGYYIRINPFGCRSADLEGRIIGIKNRPDNEKYMLVNELVSVDALALVRFGLRDANDPRMLNTVKVIDHLLKIETPCGPCWRRYNNDGYGEKADGSPYDGTGIGRAWPLLTGERAHYEIAAGRMDEARKLMDAMEQFAAHDLLPEQIWDADAIPEKDLFLGKHTGSALPLVWAHAEYVKLCASYQNKRIIDMPRLTMDRYVHEPITSKVDIWRIDVPCHGLTPGNTLRIETFGAVRVHWSADGWQTSADVDSIDPGLGIHITDLSARQLTGKQVSFTFYWIAEQRWEGVNYDVTVG